MLKMYAFFIKQNKKPHTHFQFQEFLVAVCRLAAFLDLIHRGRAHIVNGLFLLVDGGQIIYSKLVLHGTP